jgi:PAS domain S-box-containing protein
MEIVNNIYFSFFSLGAIIPVVFHLLITIFFFSIPEKSRATYHLGYAYFYITLFNFAYVFAASYYHPAAAYHRWLTVGVIMLAETHYTLFIFNYPNPGNPRTERILWVFQYLVSFLITALFMWITFQTAPIYHFDGHYWDFDADQISKWIGVVIAIYLVPFTLITIYKMMITTRSQRMIVMMLGIAYLVGSLIPAIANALSREGLIDRQFFQIVWAMVNIFGFFFLAIIYINNTRDKSAFMAKIIGISMVTFLVVLQGISYFSLNDKDMAYDDIHRHQIHRILSDTGYRPDDLRYIAAYDLNTGISTVPHPADSLVCRERIICDMENMLFAERVLGAPGKTWFNDALYEMGIEKNHLKGYSRSLAAFIPPGEDPFPSRDKITGHLAHLNFYTNYYRRKIGNLSTDDFRNDLRSFLHTKKASLQHFNDVLLEHLARSASSGEPLKGEILEFLQPLRFSGKRFYRELSSNPQHAVSFMHYDEGQNRIYEFGFSYTDYRSYIHPAASKLIFMLLGLLLFVLIGFRLFFLGTFISPMRRLLSAVNRVNQGDLDVVVPVNVGDEIGYLSESFNQMVNSIKTSRNDLIETRLYLKNIIDSMPSALIGVDRNGRVTHWNQEAERMTRISEDMVYGASIEDLVPQFRDYLDNVHKAIRTRSPRKMEKVFHQHEGENRYSDIVIYPLIANGVIGAVIRVDDITARVRFEEMMVQSEKMASVGGLAAGMAHEINNPLGGIMMAAQNIERRLSTTLRKNDEAAADLGISMETIAAYMERRNIFKMLSGILEMGHRASEIVTNMLNFSRKSDSRVSSAHINSVVESAIELAANDYNLKKHYDFRHIRIDRIYDQKLPAINCIRPEIQQVILNLLRNAAQAMAGKEYGTEQPNIRISTYRKGSMAVIEVTDNGPGMSEKIRKRVFEPFFTTKDVGAGTGLGLSVSYFIITNNHGGRMESATQIGKGTTFTIHLPL